MENGKLINNTSGRHVKALLVVHVFGNMADMVEFTRIAKEYNLILIEDAPRRWAPTTPAALSRANTPAPSATWAFTASTATN